MAGLPTVLKLKLSTYLQTFLFLKLDDGSK